MGGKKVKLLNDNDIRQVIATAAEVEIHNVRLEISSNVTGYGQYGVPRIIAMIMEENDDED